MSEDGEKVAVDNVAGVVGVFGVIDASTTFLLPNVGVEVDEASTTTFLFPDVGVRIKGNGNDVTLVFLLADSK